MQIILLTYLLTISLLPGGARETTGWQDENSVWVITYKQVMIKMILGFIENCLQDRVTMCPIHSEINTVLSMLSFKKM